MIETGCVIGEDGLGGTITRRRVSVCAEVGIGVEDGMEVEVGIEVEVETGVGLSIVTLLAKVGRLGIESGSADCGCVSCVFDGDRARLVDRLVNGILLR